MVGELARPAISAVHLIAFSTIRTSQKMYKFIVSCYYWPPNHGKIHLRALQVSLDQDQREPDLFPHKSLEQSTPKTERRQAQRLKTVCEAELTASLAILDRDAYPCSDTLLFYGSTEDLSANGISVIIPAALIDDRFRGDWARLQISLFLPTGSVRLEVNPIRWQLLQQESSRLGYLMGAQILRFDDNRTAYDDYLRSISNLAFEN